MRRVSLLLLALLAALPAAAAPPRGTVRSVEVTSLTRKAAFLFVRTHLPAAARGARQTFKGDATLWGVRVPLKGPVKVAVQPSSGGFDAVFLVDLDLASLPKGLLERGGPASIPVVLKGTLSGEAGTAATVDAAGTLRPGTSDLVAGRDLAESFLRFAGARLAGVGLAETKGEARITVFNPLGFDVALRAVRYELSSDGRVVAKGSRQGVLVRPGRENEIALPLAVSNAEALRAAAKAVAAGGTIAGDLRGEIVVKLGTGDVKVPLAAAGRVEVLK